MIIRYMGHSFFVLETESGMNVAMDPYGTFYRYPQRRVQADLCTVSHRHHDHNGLESVVGQPRVFEAPGFWRVSPGLKIIGVATSHDGQNGSVRGANTFFVVEADGLRIGHAGDLGHLPTRGQLGEIGRLDVLLLPVGGYYTIDAKQALDTIRLLNPKVTIPMHYRSRYNEEMPIACLDDFLKVTRHAPEAMPLLRVTEDDISQRPPLIVMKPEA